MPFQFEISFRLTNQRIDQIQKRIENTGSGQIETIYKFPIDRPQNGLEEWRIGIIQNVISRKESCRWGTNETVLQNWSGRRLLDSIAEFSRPFPYDPYEPSDSHYQPPPLAAAPGSRRSPEGMRRLVHAGYDLFAYPNCELSELLNIWHSQRPQQAQSDLFTCRYNDKPSLVAPLYCQQRPLHELRASQAQQWFLGLSRSGSAFEPLLVTSIFTTFAYARIQHSQGTSVVGANLDHWYAGFVPWEESAENFPDDSNRFSAWRQNRWQQIRTRLAWARGLRRMGVRVGPRAQMQELSLPVNLTTSGQTATELGNAQYTNHPCLARFIDAFNRDAQEQQRENREQG
jgi:hypothetical protein